MRFICLVSTLVVALVSGRALAFAEEAPLPLQNQTNRYTASAGPGGEIELGSLEQIRTEIYDARGRLIRFEELGPKGEHLLTWVGVYLDDGPGPQRAAYWSDDDANPFPELFVSSPDGRIQDVLYSDIGEKPRRQIRQYLDKGGREIYQEYFAPKSQRKYSEEIYRYDEDGNELGRLWRRLDGKAQRKTDFDITARDEYRSWTKRAVFIDDSLRAVDVREIVYGPVFVARPPASAGPVNPSTVILPIPFAAGVISTRAAGENVISFSPDGPSALFSRYQDNWEIQRCLLSTWREGAWREPEPVPFADTLYNAALSVNGRRIIYCLQDGDPNGARAFLVERQGDVWGEPLDLTAGHGFRGSYFRLLDDGTVYFHRDGDIYRANLDSSGSVRDERLVAEPVSTPSGTEFGAWVDVGETRLLFTRFVEGNPQSTGVFLALKTGNAWGEPRRLSIPYGWSPVISPDGEDLVYVVDDDIRRVPLALLDWPEP